MDKTVINNDGKENKRETGRRMTFKGYLIPKNAPSPEITSLLDFHPLLSLVHGKAIGEFKVIALY